MTASKPIYYRYRFPSEIISHAVWLYYRFSLSFRDVEDLLAERGIQVSYESIRQWCGKFGPEYAAKLFFRKLLKGQGTEPCRLITDKLRSYGLAHRVVMPSVVHDTTRYANNRAELSHESTRQQERQMRRFKSGTQAQRFLAVHARVGNLFRVGCHLLRAANHRLMRSRAFVEWNAVTCA